MNDLLFGLVNLAQLEVLGFKKEHFYFITLALILAVLCFVIKPIISFFSRKQYFFLLTYVLSSLLFLAFTAIFAQDVLYVAFLAVIFIGMFLSIFMIYQFFNSNV
ncbi:hypothetical protein [Pseudogracilibacillus sp. SO30301A]|uniref:hypothetical protein n=1 Tax=Pseudogracilibacillus sp. SO30301A TaxID=3098291 RepID=UPI00300E3DE3